MFDFLQRASLSLDLRISEAPASDTTNLGSWGRAEKAVQGNGKGPALRRSGKYIGTRTQKPLEPSSTPLGWGWGEPSRSRTSTR